MDDKEIAELLRAEITDEQAIFSDEGGDSGAEDDLPLQVDSASVSSTRSDNSYSHNIDSSTSPLTPKQDDLSTSLLSNEDLMSAPPTKKEEDHHLPQGTAEQGVIRIDKDLFRTLYA
ncbi:hypothetical protein J6590_072947 [Homalodisca vitripennis]|nr:hypothetical protein J6590_072947 [Homalodisca vitripennis]